MRALAGSGQLSRPSQPTALEALLQRADDVQRAAQFNKPSPTKVELPADLPTSVVESVGKEKLQLQLPFFRCPAWAVRPRCTGIHLEVVKKSPPSDANPTGETALKPIMVDRHPYYLLGKRQEVCDVAIEHPSISRVHCAIVHHHDGTVYIVDLKSANGTFLNGEKISSLKYCPVETGNEIRFGESTRSYFLQRGPVGRTRNVSAHPLRPPVPPVAPPSAVQAAATANAAVTSSSAEDPVPPKVPEIIERRFRHILIKHVDVSNPVSKAERNKGEPVTRSKDDALAIARMLRQMSGADTLEGFGQLAKDYSECATSKKGGKLGLLRKGTFVPAFDDAAFALAPGCISVPVVTGLGIHLILREAD